MKLLSIPKPKLPNISTKKTLVYSIVVLWAMALLWLWTLGTDFEILQIKPFDSIYKRWLITLISTVCLMIWFTVFLIRKLKRLNSLQLQMKKEQKDPLQIEINTQSRYLSRWLLRLQKQLVVKNFRYKLPWYLVIGNVNSGKTTFLKEGCKLNELYTPEIPQLVHCWLNESAVIIESKGQLFEQDNNSTLPTLYERLWKGILEWLVNERNRQPLNGMILTIDIYQLSTFTKTERDNYITKLKARLDDIKKILDTQ